jgi:hypothetical protein
VPDPRLRKLFIILFMLGIAAASACIIALFA